MTTVTEPHIDEQPITTAATVRLAAVAGVLAAAAAVAAADLVAIVIPGAESPVVSIGAVVIDMVPSALSERAIATFGTADKPVLITLVLIVLGVVAAAIGVSTLRNRWWGAAAVVGLGIVGLWAAALHTRMTTMAAAAPALTATVVGVAALLHQIHALAVEPTASTDADDHVAGTVAVGAGSGAEVTGPANGHDDQRTVGAADTDDGPVDEHREARQRDGAGGRRPGDVDDVAGPDTGRRTFLRTALNVAGGTVVAAGLGRLLAPAFNPPTGSTFTILPPPATPLPPVSPEASLVVDGLTPLVTPNADFYRIDTALVVPRIDVDNWTLRVTGMVDRPLELRWDDLLTHEIVEADITLACVSNEVGGDLVGTARWRGVRLADVLADAGVRPGADQLVGRAIDGFTTGSPVATVLDGRDSLIAIGMNDEPLPAEHGFPARLVVPGLYGYVSATKWLTELQLTTFDAFDAYWIPRGWASQAPIRTQARIDVPKALSTVSPGTVAVAGVAWAPTRGVKAVEVRIDDGDWKPARLAEALGPDTWRQWLYAWDATPGDHVLTVRAIDGTGTVQPGDRSTPRPDGAKGRHTIALTVSYG